MKRTKHQDINGWLIIDKPRGMGSTDVVNQMRFLLDANKNGHAGTLDPFATGVLPIAFGEATKLIAHIMNGSKEYEFMLKFGVQTDTDDSEGQVLASGGKIPSKQEILAILPQFIGKILQTPPKYSAIKINGERAYNLARRGLEPDMPAREVEIENLELINNPAPDSFSFKVRCSKGTYVRSLGRDIAFKLNTIGHLSELRRTKCSIFSLSDTILLENLKKIVYVSERQKFLLPVETSLRDIAVIAVSAEDAAKLLKGQSLSPKGFHVNAPLAAAMFKKCLVALVRVDERKVSPIRVFNLMNKETKDVDYE